MMAEGPIMSAVINRLPEEVVMLAALGIVFTLAVTLESPIMSLLNTATALVRDRESYCVVRRYAVIWAVVLTVFSALLAWSPLFDWVVRDAMGVPERIARWVQPGLGIMVLWSALIALRRFYQGVLVYYGHTRQVAAGTAVRLFSSSGTALGLLVWGGWPGIYVGATGLMVGVTAELVYTHLAVRPVVRNDLGRDRPGDAPRVAPRAEGIAPESLTMGELFRFQMPLATTSLMVLLTQPMVAAALARLDDPTLSLAAWPLIFQLTLILRAPALSLPGVILALHEREGAPKALDRFALTLAAGAFGAAVLLVATPLADFYLSRLQSAAPVVAELAHFGLVIFTPLAALTTLVVWRRGWLIARRATLVINVAMIVRLVGVAVLLGLGVSFRWPGLVTAAVALNLGNLFEFLYLSRRWARLEGTRAVPQTS